jgi:hypothetical protein
MLQARYFTEFAGFHSLCLQGQGNKYKGLELFVTFAVPDSTLCLSASEIGKPRNGKIIYICAAYPGMTVTECRITGILASQEWKTSRNSRKENRGMPGKGESRRHCQTEELGRWKKSTLPIARIGHSG